MREPEKSALLQAVVVEPHNDTPRLLYADWLDRRGDQAAAAHAEFIRLQCHLVQLQPIDSRNRLAQRAQELFQRFGRQWFPALGKIVWLDGTSPGAVGWESFPVWVIRRGFPDELVVETILQLRQISLSWPRPLPTLQRLTLGRQPDWNASNASAPRGVSSMSVGNLRTQESVADGGQIRSLAIQGRECTLQDCQALGSFMTLSELRSLKIRSLGLARPAIEQLTQAAQWPALEELRIRYSDLGRRGLLVLAKWPSARAIQRLELRRVSPGEHGLDPLGKSPLLAELRELSLPENGLHDGHVTKLTRSAALSSLESLDLSEQGIGNEGAKALASCPHLGRLKMLNLSGNPIFCAGALAIARSRYLREDCALDLRRIGAHDPSIQKTLKQRFGENVFL